ncbi:MAG TPA: hypothetical protein VHZ96_26625 [Frankiaceae bacterium]|jgi:hypothetical protein|nr:hypothetical protein [Frankiaceae bacterium]
MAYNPLEVAGPEDYPVKVGSMLLTLVDPHKGFEKAYNRWYERDHFYGGCMEGRYQIAGSRWVATREMKDLRWPKGEKVASPIDAGSFVAIYWTLAGHHKEWDDWSVIQVKDLYESGRGFPERSHVHTATFDYIGVDYRDPDGVPLTLALDHKYDAIIAVWLDGRDGRDAAATHADLSKELLPEVLKGSQLDIAASWVPSEGFRGSGRSGQPMALGTPGGDDNRLCQLFFVEGDVRSQLDRMHKYTEAVEKAGIADVLLAAPFLRTKVGTDAYVDQIW